MNSTIILIGPLGAGKTTVGRLLAEKLDSPFCSIDELRWMYYEKVGYDKAQSISLTHCRIRPGYPGCFAL